MIKSYIYYMKNPRNDEWYTPVYGVLPIIKHIKDKYSPEKTVIWCPFDNESSNYVIELKKHGYKVIASHKDEKRDFFKWQPSDRWDIIVSNPPFSIKDQVLSRAYQLQKPFALLLPLSALEGVSRNKLYIKNGLQLLKFDRRISFNNTRGISFATGYFCWKIWGDKNKLIHEVLDLNVGD